MSDKLVLEGYLRTYGDDIRLHSVPNPESWLEGRSVGEIITDTFGVEWNKETSSFEFGKFRITVEKIE